MGPGERFRLRRRGPILWLGLGVLVLLAAGWLAVGHVDRAGVELYQRGRGVVEGLERLARALAAGDALAVSRGFAVDYAGRPLGLADRQLVRNDGGIRVLRFVAGTRPTDRAAALAEWRAYLARFDTIEEVRLHLHRLERWNDPADVRARVRFELIGRPRGARHAVIDRATLAMRLALAADGDLHIRGADLIDGERVETDRPHFADVSRPAGIDFENRFYPGFLDRPLRFPMIRYGPGGISAADVDGDGFHDLFVPDGVASRLLRNRRDGTFQDITGAAGLAGLDGVSVGLFADYDNDGRKDLFVSRTFRPNQLFHNEGPGAGGVPRFADVTARSGLGADCCTTVASWADYDNDGRLDLYVGRYLDPRARIPTTFYARNGEPNQLYRNEGDGTFTNVTREAGVGDTGLCLGTAFGDVDDDGWPDLWVANDFGRKTLYRNAGARAAPGGRPRFEDVTVASGTLAYGAGMSANVADYDNDGRLDLYVTHIRSEHAWFAEPATVRRTMVNSFRQGVWRTDLPLYLEIFRDSRGGFAVAFRQMASGNNLLRNRGDGTFEDVTEETGENPPGWFWGAVVADLDNDGWQDVYATNGWIYGRRGTELELDFLDSVVGHQDVYKTGALFDPARFGGRSWHGWERNRHLRSRGRGSGARVTFDEVGRAAGTDLLRNSRGVAAADFWNRGRLDLAVAASTDRHALLRNEAGEGEGWLQVELVGTQSNRDAVGARVTARVGALRLTREVVLGDGYASQSMLRLHFGLGEARRVDELTVRWPRSGIVQTFREVQGGRIVEVVEGRSELVEKRYGAGG